jgi:hypothetical protein
MRTPPYFGCQMDVATGPAFFEISISVRHQAATQNLDSSMRVRQRITKIRRTESGVFQWNLILMEYFYTEGVAALPRTVYRPAPPPVVVEKGLPFTDLNSPTAVRVPVSGSIL